MSSEAPRFDDGHCSERTDEHTGRTAAALTDDQDAIGVVAMSAPYACVLAGVTGSKMQVDVCVHNKRIPYSIPANRQLVYVGVTVKGLSAFGDGDGITARPGAGFIHLERESEHDASSKRTTCTLLNHFVAEP